MDQAIQNLDYLAFRQLLQDRKATPFDLIEFPSGSRYTMLEHVLSSVRPEKNCAAVVTFVRLLAESGVNCGGGLALFYLLHYFQQSSALNDLLPLLLRMILSHSESDPFMSMPGAHPSVRFVNQYNKNWLPLFLGQDDWDLSEYQQEFEKYSGRGAWEYCMSEGDYTSKYDWNQLQKNDWLQRPATFQYSKEDCLQQYGGDFVRHDWPLLYWEHRRPTLWRSKEACLGLFGEYFVEYCWGRLYWQEERPPFWPSQKACSELFGNSFTEFEWPKSLGKNSFEVAEGDGSWHFYKEYYHGWWSLERREEWIYAMATSWWQDTQIQRQSQEHCLKKYGYNFVKDTWPELLREDGLSEDEVLLLVEDISFLEWVDDESESDSDEGYESAVEDVDGDEEGDVNADIKEDGPSDVWDSNDTNSREDIISNPTTPLPARRMST